MRRGLLHDGGSPHSHVQFESFFNEVKRVFHQDKLLLHSNTNNGHDEGTTSRGEKMNDRKKKKNRTEEESRKRVMKKQEMRERMQSPQAKKRMAKERQDKLKERNIRKQHREKSDKNKSRAEELQESEEDIFKQDSNLEEPKIPQEREMMTCNGAENQNTGYCNRNILKLMTAHLRLGLEFIGANQCPAASVMVRTMHSLKCSRVSTSPRDSMIC
jgi:hypothetical protein